MITITRIIMKSYILWTGSSMFTCYSVDLTEQVLRLIKKKDFHDRMQKEKRPDKHYIKFLQGVMCAQI